MSPNPFVVGRRYRVVREFKALRDEFRRGEILVFKSEAYSRYDGITGYFFAQPGIDGLRRWDVPDQDNVTTAASALFEEFPMTPDEARAFILADDVKPVAADIPVGKHALKRHPNGPTTAGRIFGGLLAFLSLWEVLTPENATGTLLGVVGLIVSALWFVRCPRYLRLLATAALFAWLLLVLLRAPPYAPRRHAGRVGAAGALHDQTILDVPCRASAFSSRSAPRLPRVAG